LKSSQDPDKQVSKGFELVQEITNYKIQITNYKQRGPSGAIVYAFGEVTNHHYTTHHSPKWSTDYTDGTDFFLKDLIDAV
jgi:hypothetical protein